MSERWFRFHEGVINDPKVQRLPAEIFKTWVNLLCLASQQKERGILPEMTDDIAFALRMDGAECRRHLDALQKAGLIDVETGREVMHNFLGRQYDKPSDRPEATAQRQREARERQKEVTPSPPRGVEASHAPVTPVSRDIVIEYAEEYTETEKTPPKPPVGGVARDTLAGFDEFWDAYPRKEAKQEAQKAWKRLKPDEDACALMLRAIARAKENSDPWQRGIIPHPASWLNGKRWHDEIAPPATSLTVRGRASPRLEPGQSANSAVANDIANHLRSLGAH